MRMRKLAAVMLLALSVALVPIVSQASVAGTGSGHDTNAWWGVLGAALCGMEGRLAYAMPAIGMQPAMIAVGIAGCLLAFMDGTT